MTTSLRAKLAAFALALCGLGTAAQAVTFGPDDWVNQNNNPISISATATMTDSGSGALFSLQISGSSIVQGDTLQIGLDGVTFATSDISSVSTNTGDGVTVACNGCSGSFTGGGPSGAFSGAFSAFDTIVQVGVNGSASGLNTMVSFFVNGISEFDLTAVALRLQTVSGCSTGCTSLKLLNSTPSEIPLPASALLLLGGLGAFGAVRARRKA